MPMFVIEVEDRRDVGHGILKSYYYYSVEAPDETQARKSIFKKMRYFKLYGGRRKMKVKPASSDENITNLFHQVHCLPKT